MRTEFAISYRDFADAQTLHQKLKTSERIARVLLPLFALFGLVILAFQAYLVLHGRSSETDATEWTCGLILLSLPFIRSATLALTWRRMYRRTSTGRQCNIEFAESGIHPSSSVSSGDMLWSAFRSYTEGEKSFLLYLSPGRFLAIPKRVLSEIQIDELRSLLSTHIGRTGIPPKSLEGTAE